MGGEISASVRGYGRTWARSTCAAGTQRRWVQKRDWGSLVGPEEPDSAVPIIQLLLSTEQVANDCQLHSQTITVRGIVEHGYILVTAVQALSLSSHALE